MEKICSRCKIKQSVDKFSRKKAAIDGKQAYCKSCSTIKRRERYRANPEIGRAEARKQYHKDPKKHIERNRRWREANWDKVLSNRKRYEIENKELIAERSRAWVEANPEKVSAARQRRRALVAGAEGDFIASAWLALCEKYDHRCLCCGLVKPLTVDHVIPLSKQGSNRIENLQPLCKPCNSSKGVKLTDYR